MGWLVYNVIHVVPEDDLVGHVLLSTCVCGPDLSDKSEAGMMYTHHSLDGRELSEPDRD
jgi:hypothetical protein